MSNTDNYSTTPISFDLSYNFTDNDWSAASVNGNKVKDLNKPVSTTSDWVVGAISEEVNDDIVREYKFFMNIEDWKQHKYKNIWLWEKNTKDPIVAVIDRDDNGTIVDEQIFSKSDFKNFNKRIYNWFENRMKRNEPIEIINKIKYIES